MFLNMRELSNLVILDLLNCWAQRIKLQKLYLDHLLTWLPRYLIINLIIAKLISGPLVWLSIKCSLESKLITIQSAFHCFQYHWSPQENQKVTFNFSSKSKSSHIGRPSKNVGGWSSQKDRMEWFIQTSSNTFTWR